MPSLAKKVFISSTKIDLEEYRNVAIRACHRVGLLPIYMETFPPDPRDAVKTCIAKVDEADVFVGLYAHRYGFVPDGADVSMIEMEYDRAIERNLSVYLFVVDPTFRWDPTLIDRGFDYERLERFKKKLGVRHVYKPFRDVQSFTEDVLLTLKDLALPDSQLPAKVEPSLKRRLPAPPELFSVPPFILSNSFIGRHQELGELNLWAQSKDSVFVIKSIGGTGKSALAWHWTQDHAPRRIANFTGAVWWSFYENGASTISFVREAFAYITLANPEAPLLQAPLEDLAQRLLNELRERPFLLVLDGFERMLKGDQFDSLRVDDDVIVVTDHRQCIDEQTSKFLQHLTSCSPSKILLTTRTMPSALENHAHQPIPGVRYLNLSGLAPADGELFLRRFGVHGESEAIQRSLAKFDNHSLLISLLAARIIDYRPSPGNFDRWLADPREGGELRLVGLDVRQIRKLILSHTFSDLKHRQSQLLRRLAALGEGIDYEALSTINPYLSSRPAGPSEKPRPLDFGSSEHRSAVAAFDADLRELEDRGLLEWDRRSGRYSMHPVVRLYALDSSRDPFEGSSTNRLGSQIVKASASQRFFEQIHVIFGGTGAVGGATALQMISLFEEASRLSPLRSRFDPRIVVTGRTKHELRQFTRLLFEIQQRDHGGVPQRIDGGYRTVGGVTIELTTFGVDPTIPGLEDFAFRDHTSRRQMLTEFLGRGDLDLDSPLQKKIHYLRAVLEREVSKPFTQFLTNYREGQRVRSVVVGLPLASIAAYKLNDLQEAALDLGVERGDSELEVLRNYYLRALRDDLAHVAEHLADEVLAAHTTAVGGMYDVQEDGGRTIRLGFAHSALDTQLRHKQIFAEKLARLYSERGIKMLITAAAIGVDAVLARVSPPLNVFIKRQLLHEEANGNRVLSEKVNSRMRVYQPVDLDLLLEEPIPVIFSHGHPMVLDFVLRSGENGYFTVSNTDALYRVMRVTSSSELGLLLARTAVFGDDTRSPVFVDNQCYYRETDNSRQVFDLLGQPQLRRNQLSGLQPKALQDLGSAKHQAELHTLGLLILLHRLKTLELEALPPHVDLRTFDPQEYFESHSRALTLDNVMSWRLDALAADLTCLVTARAEEDLKQLKGYFQADPDRQEAAHRVFQSVLWATWAIPSIGTPIIYEAKDRRRVVAGYYASSIDRIITHRNRLSTHLRQRFEELGGGDEEDFERFVEFHIANNGFADLRPLAVLVSARSDKEDLTGRVQVFRREADFVRALRALEPYSYFTSSGLLALLVRLKGLCRLAHELDFGIGTANEFRAQIPHDDYGRPLLVPGVVEAFRMVSEGLEKNTGSERLGGRWGYYLERGRDESS